MATEPNVTDDEKRELHEFLVGLLTPMTDSRTVGLYMTTLQDRDAVLKDFGPEFVRQAEETLRGFHEPHLLETWTEQLDKLNERSLTDGRFRQTAGALLRDLELSLAEAWIRARFESWLPLAAMSGLDRSKIDIEAEIRTFLNVMRIIPTDAGGSPALTAIATAGESPALKAIQIGLRSVQRTPEDWYGDYCTDSVYDWRGRQATSLAEPKLALPLLGISFCDDRRRVIPSRYHWAYRATDWGGSIAMRWVFYRLLEPKQTQPMLRRISYASARDNDTLIPDGAKHWMAMDASTDPRQDEYDDENRLGRAEELYNRGFALQNDQNLPAALKTYEEVLSLLKEGEYPPLESALVGNLGNVYHDLGQFDRAVMLHERALSIRRAIGDQEGEGLALATLGMDYREKGDKVRACGYFGDSLKLLQPRSALHRQVREWMKALGCPDD